MAPTFYMIDGSPPARAVLMTAKTIGLNLDIKDINPLLGEQKTPEFLKMNPQHTIPVLKDEDGFVVWDSHAIMPYILSKYAKNDSLYPKDPKKRAVVDQRLHFDSGVAWARALKILVPMVYKGVKVVPQSDIDNVNEVYAFIETFLDGKKWIAGDSVTIADFSYVTTVTALDVLVKVDRVKFPKVADYVKRATALPAYAVAKHGHQEYTKVVQPMFEKMSIQ